MRNAKAKQRRRKRLHSVAILTTSTYTRLHPLLQCSDISLYNNVTLCVFVIVGRVYNSMTYTIGNCCLYCRCAARRPTATEYLRLFIARCTKFILLNFRFDSGCPLRVLWELYPSQKNLICDYYIGKLATVDFRQ